MKKLFLLLFILIIGKTSFCQFRDKEIRCSPNPTIIKKLNRKIIDNKVVDSVYTIKILNCVASSPFGLKFELGYSKYYYNNETAGWLGQHGGPDFNFILAIENANIGLRFRPWTGKNGQNDHLRSE